MGQDKPVAGIPEIYTSEYHYPIDIDVLLQVACHYSTHIKQFSIVQVLSQFLFIMRQKLRSTWG